MPKPKFPRIIFTDDAWILNTDPPVKASDLREKAVNGYADTGGALWWSTGDHEVYHFETKIGEIFGFQQQSHQDLDHLHSFVHSAGGDDSYPKIAANVRALIDESGGPLNTMLEACREKGIPFFPRIRMNSHYAIDSSHPAYGNYRRQHPDRLISGPEERFPEGTIEHGIGTGLDYTHPENRNFITSIICECFERFDVDGVELDFMRHPAFFRIEEGFANRHFMTSLVHEVRKRMEAASVKHNRRLLLGVRVPPGITDCNRIGIDIVSWIDEKLVDIVVVGGGFISFETPVDEFVRAADGSETLVYGCIEATRDTDDRKLRALAYRWLSDGADGIYLYNFFTRSPEWNRRIASELTEIDKLHLLDKRYELEFSGSAYGCGGHGCAFNLAQSPTQLPVQIQPNYYSVGPVLRIPIADNLEEARAQGVLGSCQLTLQFETFETTDSLSVYLNGTKLNWDQATTSFDGWNELTSASLFWLRYPADPVEKHVDGVSVAFEVSPPTLLQGENEVTVHLHSDKRPNNQHISMIGLVVDVTYLT